VKRQIDTDRFPEWQPFVDAVQQRRPDAGTWCEAWTVRDIVAHQAGNAEELARVLRAHLEGEPVGTRGFEEREGPLRALNDADLWDALHDRMAALNEVAAAGEGIAGDLADTDVAWTGRTMKVPWFAEHMREELVLHGWDITGDCDTSPTFKAGLGEPWMTAHSVAAVGRPLLAKGAKQLRPGERIEARLRVPGTDDILISADADQTYFGMTDPEGPATLETDAAARVLLLWGRRPGDPSRICSGAGPETLGQVRRLLSGY
jgi:Mycothiol maleylpyruvate isomerase N-terminal domain